jgi:hypothetical protein
MNAKFARLLLAAVFGIACAFSPVFAADSPGTFTLAWTTPWQNEDGSPLTDLQGFYVYVGLTPDALQPMYFTAAPRIVLGHSGPGRRYYYAVTAVNTSGVQSALSGILSDPAQ